MKRYMTVIMTLALLLASISTTAFAQSKKASSKTTASATTDQAQVLAHGAEALERAGRYPYDKPGEKPVVLKSELECAFGDVRKLLTETQVSALWDGDYDTKCKTPGLIPISQRLTNNFYLLIGAKDEQALHDVKAYLHEANFELRDYQPARKVNGKWVAEGPQPDMPLTYSTRPAGSKTLDPPTAIGFVLNTILVDGVRINYGENAGKGVRLAIIRGFTKDDGTAEEPCLNFTGEFGQVAQVTAPIVEKPAEQKSLVTEQVAPTKLQSEPQTVMLKAAGKSHEHRSGMLFEAGIAFRLGSVNSSYSGAVQPGTGDATQLNSFTSVQPVIRVEPNEGSGLFASGDLSLLDKTGAKKFNDPVTKIRDSDSTKDQRYEALVGWQFGLNGVGLAPFAGWQSFCLCEKYTAQGANTQTERAYKQFIVGAQAKFAAGQRAIVRIRGDYGHGTRTQWTHQTLGSIDFPKVDQPKATASSFEVRPEIDVHVVGPLHAIATFDFTHIMSQRTNTFVANEAVNVPTLTFGVTVGFGR